MLTSFKLSLQRGQYGAWSKQRSRQLLQNECPQGVVTGSKNNLKPTKIYVSFLIQLPIGKTGQTNTRTITLISTERRKEGLMGTRTKNILNVLPTEVTWEAPRTGLTYIMTTGHMWHWPFEWGWSTLRCARNVKYMPDFKDFMQNK